MCGKRLYAWNTIPAFRRRGGTWLTTWPPMTSRPPSGMSNPAAIRKAVVFPHPEGPSSVTSFPPGTVREKSSRATTFPNRRVTWPYSSVVMRAVRSCLADRSCGRTGSGG
jgi:hypothetical protein